MNSYGIGQVGDNGILSRSFEDLHPDPSRYVTVWNGTMAAHEQKAAQHSPSPRLCATCQKPLLGFLGLRMYHPACRPPRFRDISKAEIERRFENALIQNRPNAR